MLQEVAQKWGNGFVAASGDGADIVNAWLDAAVQKILGCSFDCIFCSKFFGHDKLLDFLVFYMWRTVTVVTVVKVITVSKVEACNEASDMSGKGQRAFMIL